MVHGYHLIFGMYGFWLPNDPRGSWSDFVGKWELLRFGKATKVTTPRSLAHEPHDHSERLAAKKLLKYPPVSLNGVQARAVGRGFGTLSEKSKIVIWACAIMPEHVHLVIARHRLRIERIAIALKSAATRQAMDEDVHPLKEYREEGQRPPKMFGRGEWKAYLDDADDIGRAIAYVENNPIREEKPPQRWSFVRRFEGI
ncbi:MAG: hypothetical protein K8T25_13400 [Planctomycetia bacterium]|nr:hypothetical protein [Planctomycetia bacterium]